MTHPFAAPPMHVTECGTAPRDAAPAAEPHGTPVQPAAAVGICMLPPIRRGVTERQRMLLQFIHSSMRDRGFAPSVREMGAFLGSTSTNNIACHLTSLERRGLIHRESKLSRALTLTDAGLATVDPSLAALAEGSGGGGHFVRGELDRPQAERRDGLMRRQRVLLLRASALLAELAPKSALLDAIRGELGEVVT